MSEQKSATKSKGYTLIVLLCIVLVASIVFGVITYLDRNTLASEKDELNASYEQVSGELVGVKAAAAAGGGGRHAGEGRCGRSGRWPDGRPCDGQRLG